MNAVLSFSGSGSSFEVLSVDHLGDLYNGVIDELRFCANVSPVLEIDPVAADKREADLLSLEEDLLQKAANIQLYSKDDILKLMDIWEKSSDINTGEDVGASDRIAMNIFRHLTNAKFTIV